MSVQSNPKSSGILFRLLLSFVITVAVFSLASVSPVRGQDEPETIEEVSAILEAAATDESELWSAVVERYEVVVLSRGLLLEPLDADIELRTIEVSSEGIAVDGDDVALEEVSDLIGEDDAALVLQLVEMDQNERSSLFEDSSVAAVEVVVDDQVSQHEEADDEFERHTTDTQVIVGRPLIVEADETVRDAVVFGAPLEVYGKVIGDATAIGGTISVEGEVTGSVVAVGGSIALAEDAEILGDAVSVGGRIERADGSRIMGEVVEVPFIPSLTLGGGAGSFFRNRALGRPDLDLDTFSPMHIATTFMWAGFRLVVVVLFAFLVMLLAKKPMERIRRRVASQPWKSGLVGLLTQIFILPLLIMVVIVLCVSIIGIPLLLLVPFACLALVLAAFVGFCSVCWSIGLFLADRFGWKLASPYLELLIGVIAVQVLTIIGHLLDVGWAPLWFFGAMLCIAGAMIQYAAWTIGLGSAVLTRFGTAEGWKPDEPPTDQQQVPEETISRVLVEEGSGREDPSVSDFDLDPGPGSEPEKND